ncbi:MAG: methylenetetrahydrofolate--tRNA-(uracil(54)-C(5))-methyltransferase (FADH(2)-oxidizing) TrmFO [Nitrospinota bacterium]
MSNCSEVIIIGGGLAGCEAAWQVAERGVKAKLYEMRPIQNTPAHSTSFLSELLCSNSFRSNSTENAAGLLKEEMRRLNSIIIHTADETRVPAGLALAVDRNRFGSIITEIISRHANIEVVRKEVTEIPPDSTVIIASGPLTSDSLAEHIKELVNEKHLYFYDAISPIVDGESIDYEKVFFGSRYNKGGADYINCPMSEEEYYRFWEDILKGKKIPLRDFENISYFEGCMPIEVMAERGKDTLSFGPFKPVGLQRPDNGERPYAVVQLRREDTEGRLYNMVGMQTKLTYSEQKRIFRTIPGLESVEFVRYGSVHRNTFVNSPRLLIPTLQLKERDRILFAGQITGVEGYIESAATGLLAGINAVNIVKEKEPLIFPDTTSIGALLRYITTSGSKNFQPMNINFGLFPPLKKRIKERSLRNNKIVQRALDDLDKIMSKDRRDACPTGKG